MENGEGGGDEGNFKGEKGERERGKKGKGPDLRDNLCSGMHHAL